MTHLSEHNFPSETAILWLSYFLFILLITTPIGALISTMKSRRYKRLINQSGASDTAEHAFPESHHQWLVRTFIGAVITAMMALDILTLTRLNTRQPLLQKSKKSKEESGQARPIPVAIEI